ncbi:bifunctional adenosylcobinamide kinase/adenosylcobinamide-phosphate guanylyltransferase [Roseinatronobacter sp.]|uniref:bifunctional adenosylcobinamide kinase/adenosylcobinamide-phosphate guanylyltransferase n=1 Tax=Roseinatronobacter sp. TaxID=1945755 RepID=UPI0025F4F088|nr:bifunctional adenosylcobinamide kinase/adenosylcobinamide-phosphate guanylyltransferase [Rhodobaca sp.]
MSESILYIGGARSGKSRLAEARTLQYDQPATYIATAQAWDDGMKARIAAHQAQREGSAWHTHAEPRDLVGVLNATDGSPRLVDCLTLWLTNIMLADQDWQAEGRALVAALAVQSAPVVLVSNEVGMGIVPDNRLARDFRDAAGILNQWVANAADEVHFVAAGLSMRMK